MKDILEKIKNYYNSNKQKVNLLGSLILVMLVIIIAISIAVKIVGLKISYEQLEEKMENAARVYLADNPALLPSSTNPTVVVEASTLIEGKYLKNLRKYVKDSSCTGNVLVDYKNGAYKYQAYLTCNKFKTKKFLEILKENNTISGTGEGLYEMNGELVYRGQEPNNYIRFAGELWRIVKIDKNKNIQIIITELEKKQDIYNTWDDRYNTEKGSQYGINDYSLSRALVTVNNYYDTKYKKYQDMLSKLNACYGKRADESISKDGSLECNDAIKDQYISLLPLYDYMNASLDGLCATSISRECQNYNYLVSKDFTWWTMTANLKSTYHVYKIKSTGQIDADYASSKATLRYVLSLNADVLYTDGDGTYENPYTIR